MQKPMVKPTTETAPFWESCNRGELSYQCCAICGEAQFPPSVVCVHCHSDRLEWRVSSGRGTVHNFTVVERAPLPVFKAQVPYVIALVDFEEGFRMMMNVQTDQPYAVGIGMPVAVVFEEHGDVRLPQAALVPGPGLR